MLDSITARTIAERYKTLCDLINEDALDEVENLLLTDFMLHKMGRPLFVDGT